MIITVPTAYWSMVQKMWSCSLCWRDENKAQKIHVFFDPGIPNSLKQNLESIFLNRMRKMRPVLPPCCILWFPSLPLALGFLVGPGYKWSQDIWNSLSRGRKGLCCYCYCDLSVVIVNHYCSYHCRETRNPVWEVERGPLTREYGWIEGKPRAWDTGRVTQDVTNKNNATNTQSTQNWKFS